MVLGLTLTAYTILHVILSVIGIATGLVAVGGLLAGNRLPITTAVFLITTLATTLGGFLFPFNGFTPAIGVGIVSTIILLVTIARALLLPPAGRVALGLCRRRGDRALPQLLRAGRAVLPQGAGARTSTRRPDRKRLSRSRRASCSPSSSCSASCSVWRFPAGGWLRRPLHRLLRRSLSPASQGRSTPLFSTWPARMASNT